MRILLTKQEVEKFAAKYDYGGDEKIADVLAAAVKRGEMTRDDLVEIAKWKWRGARVSQLAKQNTESEVNEISRVAFSAKCERLRTGALLALRGVNWPMASVILHFAFPDRFPILDKRAMKAVGGSTVYTFDKWVEYTELCRKTAKDMRISMRTLDRALWASDKKKENAAATTTTASE